MIALTSVRQAFTSLLLDWRPKTTTNMTTDSRGFIESLDHNEVFVFGSNLQGHHIGGAARTAIDKFGAVWGVGVGIQGQSYAIPTMEIDLDNIALYIKQFIDYATITPDKIYYVTPVATGIAGFSREEMGEVWSRWKLPENVKLI